MKCSVSFCLVSTSSANTLDVGNLSCLQWGPLPTLVVPNTECHKCEDDHVLASVLLAFLRLWLSCPAQELSHISGLLRDSSDRPIVILDTTITKRRGHGDGTTREVRVVMKTRHHFLSCRWLAISSQQRKDVVGSVVSSLDHQTQVRRVGTAVGSTPSLLVGVRRWKNIVGLARALKHLTLVVGSVQDVDILGHFFNFICRVCHSNQFAETNVM
mmetsp:Transcript_11532/g.21284  ORF Transcript_11532/g.21284 Transcript_11532/m.21284 type:complete len:214 (+) Transcript_11532:127-768(+)